MLRNQAFGDTQRRLGLYSTVKVKPKTAGFLDEQPLRLLRSDGETAHTCSNDKFPVHYHHSTRVSSRASSCSAICEAWNQFCSRNSPPVTSTCWVSLLVGSSQALLVFPLYLVENPHPACSKTPVNQVGE
mmetsp:Transcript_33791/g.67598  ORF Transcript_33791/g.67598 Transcript_33791/m.67598 type:complete len:130 (-) Transcript_33791:23-412(-)